MNNNALTPAELNTLKTVLRTGGIVVACMGKLYGNRVNKRTLDRLEARGLITIAGNYRAGPCKLDVTVTAQACELVNQITINRTLDNT